MSGLKARYAIGVIMISIVFLTVSFAAGEVSVIGKISTPGIDLRISGTPEKTLLAPGKKINYAPVIENAGEAAYIRIKMETNGAEIPLENFYGFTEEWIRRGTYYYCTSPLMHGDEKATFKGFRVPFNYNGEQNDQIHVIQRCDAVQAKNFTPAFEEEEPWGDTLIRESWFSGDTYMHKDGQTNPLVLSFQSGGEAELSSEMLDDFALLPGDRVGSHLVLENRADSPLQITVKVFADDKKLAHAVTLDLDFGEKKICRASLADSADGKKKQVGLLAPGERAILKYSLTLPANLDNGYAGKETKFVWTFTAEEVSGSEKITTGDERELWSYAGMFILALVTISVLLAVKGKENNYG